MVLTIMKITVEHIHHHHHEMGPKLEGLLVAIIEGNAMISQQVQDALTRIQQTQTLAASVAQGLQLQSGQIATLTQTVADLNAKLAAGGTLGSDDLGALTEISNDIDQVNAQLQQAIPANTSGSSAGAGASPSAAAGQPAPNGPSGPTGDAGVADNTAKPLAGTGS